eukprot:907134_1
MKLSSLDDVLEQSLQSRRLSRRAMSVCSSVNSDNSFVNFMNDNALKPTQDDASKLSGLGSVPRTHSADLAEIQPRRDSIWTEPIIFDSSSLGNKKSQGSETVLVESEDSDVPLRLDFENINFSVHTETGLRHIVKGCSGFANPGEILAIIGPSGCGKTSLLNILASRVRPGTQFDLTGRVLINGRSCKASVVKQVIAYVMQDDVFLPYMTAREHVELSAQLKLQKGKINSDMARRVDAIMELLGLSECQHVRIGKSIGRGLSGGQRKRLGIAAELVNNPRILCLDEPTTGLDSLSSMELIELLSTLARAENQAVILTIHQPTYNMWRLFDKVCMIGDGHILFHGPTANVAGYLDNLGYICPKYMNPADHIIHLSNTEYPEDREVVNHLATSWNSFHSVMDRQSSIDYEQTTSVSKFSHQMAPFTLQLKLLVIRNLKVVIRDPNKLILYFIVCVTVALIFGTMFFRLDTTEAGVINRSGALFIIMAYAFFSQFNTMILTVPGDKIIFKREYMNNLYSTMAFYLAKLIVDLPIRILTFSIMMAIVYPMATFKASAVSWFLLLVIMYGSGLYGYGMGFLMGAITRSAVLASLLSPLLLMIFLLLGGYVVPLDSQPIAWRWVAYINPLRYSFEAALVVQFEDFVVSGCSDPG